MDITRLRKCTFKSTADFYYKSNWTVQKLWEEKPIELVRVYYELEKITFIQEVLDAIKEKFSDFFEIEKPGKFEGDWKKIILKTTKPDYTQKSHKELLSTMRGYVMNGREVPLELRRCFLASKAKKLGKQDNMDLQYSKKHLQSINHGNKI